ncbi:SGNH/GDSL hydrolase family protein [Ferroacidibacillus organovorans]|uniref:SGNH hydrolase-type esterase domain-containing protein n=1 Tax=Ferroacidibacillus organovorans TaxID=1765683 RepID=A0A853KDK6_9BACL|nr:SGNH/GDSL hydrolase family protein [Ferroacidibacillus organovorans]KYP80972.1 hypothetical protein AYJ22_09320 [Ferroacidibacillus organovorans]OAG93490.1 hypothetical protein AYW79_10455 [Ferroacidibacillus organovorans]
MNRLRRRHQRILRNRVIAGVFLAVILLFAVGGHLTYALHRSVSKPKALPKGPIRVMAIGSSVAKGWDDKTGGGYLARGVAGYAKGVHHALPFVNHAVEGETAEAALPLLPSWIKAIHPNVLLISWGMLDDATAKTPLSVFSRTIRQEISLAIANHETVWVVTPPVTPASYTVNRVSEAQYVSTELAVAHSYPAREVSVFDVFNQMKAYIASHHQNYKMYAADAWHPNTAGHVLAGRLLAHDLLSGSPAFPN